jgi:hypothetical protein
VVGDLKKRHRRKKARGFGLLLHPAAAQEKRRSGATRNQGLDNSLVNTSNVSSRASVKG